MFRTHRAWCQRIQLPNDVVAATPVLRLGVVAPLEELLSPLQLEFQLGTLLSGAVLTEKVFSWTSGLGTYMVEAALRTNQSVLMGCMMLFAATTSSAGV